MSTEHNDLTQSLMAECRRKDALIDAYKEKLKLADMMIDAKDQRLQLYEKHIEDLRELIATSIDQTDRVIAISNTIFK
jgi:hypothetical protein